MERPGTADPTHTVDRAAERCIVCGHQSSAPLCSLACRSEARAETERNRSRIERLRELGFDAQLDEVQSVVRRNLELARAIDDPRIVLEPAGGW